MAGKLVEKYTILMHHASYGTDDNESHLVLIGAIKKLAVQGFHGKLVEKYTIPMDPMGYMIVNLVLIWAMKKNLVVQGSFGEMTSYPVMRENYFTMTYKVGPYQL